MSRILFSISISFFLSAGSLYSQALPELIPFRKGDKWGYADSTKKIIVPCRFTRVNKLENGYAAVFSGNKFGYVDSTGKIYHEAEFDYDDHKSNGFFEGYYMPVLKNGKMGLIHKSGKWVVQPVYDFLYFYGHNRLLARKGNTSGYLDTAGMIIFPFLYEHVGEDCNGLYIVKKGGKYGLSDVSGKLVVPLAYDHMHGWSDGMLRVGKDSVPGANSYYHALKGYLDSTGKEVHPCTLTRAGSFSEGFAAVAYMGKYGFIDKKGNYLVTFTYDLASAFSCGRACVTKNGKYGYIDKNGREVIPLIYSTWNVTLNYGQSFRNNVVVVEMDKGKTHGILDTNGNAVVPCVYPGIWWENECGFYIVKDGKSNSSTKIYYPGGKLVSIWESRDYCYFPDGIHHFSIGAFDSLYCFITMDGDTLNNRLYMKQNNPSFFTAFNFSEGLCAITENGRAGFINATGKTVIPCRYDNVTPMQDGLSFVKSYSLKYVEDRRVEKTRPLGYIDRYGTEYWED